MSKVFTKHKNGDVSIRLTPIERDMISCFIGKMRYGLRKEHPVFDKVLVSIFDRKVTLVPFNYNGVELDVSVVTFEPKE